MFSVQNLSPLSYIYKELYEVIFKLRPSIEGEYQRIHNEIDHWDWDAARDCKTAEKAIRSTMGFVGEQLDWIDQQKELSNESRLFMISSLYRLIYSHANYWYVLIDGVIFEGLAEVLSEHLIKKVASELEQSELVILSDLVEPLTDYQYTAISIQREQSAQDMLFRLKSRNQQLYHELNKFIQTYSSIKEYQLMFNELHGTYFQPLIPRCHKKIVDLIELMGIRELSTDDMMPWNLLLLLWDDILPAMLVKECCVSNNG